MKDKLKTNKNSYVEGKDRKAGEWKKISEHTLCCFSFGNVNVLQNNKNLKGRNVYQLSI